MEEKTQKFMICGLLFFFFLTSATTDENPDKTFSNFQSSIDTCNKTCECTIYSGLFILNCANRDLHNTLSNWPSHKNKTLSATFSYNTITTLEQFPASNSSAMLSVDHCGIKFLAPGLFENMKNVRYVDMSHNLITIEELSSEKFKGPYSNTEFEPIELTHLNLAYNQIHSLPNSLFEHMPRLKHLNLEGNVFKILDLQTQAALTDIPYLEHLNLANNALKSLPKEMFNSLKNLVELNLSKNQLQFVPDVLAVIETLEVLILDSNPINELTDSTFAVVPNLVELSLNNLSNVVVVHSNTFAPLKKLRKLHICNNKILEDIEPDAFGIEQNLSLKEVYMNNNALLDIPSLLLDWTSLHIFEFNDNPFLCTCNLYNISKLLNGHITRKKAGPYCIGEEEKSFQVFSLDERVCHEEYLPSLSFMRSNPITFPIIRVALISMTLVAVTGTFIAMVVCFAKQRKYGIFGDQFSRSTSVIYNPLNTQPTL